MNAVSLFSGVGGFELGFQRAGIETVMQAERDPWCLSVLERHWPDVERVTDVRDVRADTVLARPDHESDEPIESTVGRPDADLDWSKNAGRRSQGPQRRGVGGNSVGVGVQPADSRGGIVASVDLVYGGFPCQDISVAGRRAGLGGERSGEWFEFERVLRELRPRWAVIENVAGLLSSGDGSDLAVILSALDDIGFDAAWAVLDAKYFGVPQRRQRVFIVAGPRGRGAEQVLSLCEGCGGNPPPSGETGECTTGALTAGTLRAGGVNGGNNPGGGYLGDVVSALAASGRGVANAVRPRDGGPKGADHETYILDIAWALQERDAKGPDSSTKEGHLIPGPVGVRRLTPREAERLMGWPDDHTRYTADDREIADTHRYRMAGNGVAAPVAEWIGHRLVAVDRLIAGSS